MFRYILAFIIIVPALEIWLLVLAGNKIGPIPTVLLIILTGFLGAWLARRQGLETLQKAQLEMQSYQLPGDRILDGIMILVGGVVLLTPGFITDAIGFFLLFPQSRSLVKPFLIRWLRNMMNNGNITFYRRW
ncbi:FxsA family protein [Bacillus marinisedimentorum]|uniref:FxsA family protein n=1 Tax=Bacillus marinisedimentorum TaxID=1821260 RepID=UPI0008726700|nr:FxsA family protein [Bacillus marinisedimentorum]